MKPSTSKCVNRSETIVLLGNYRPTLVLARVLSKRGYRVIAGLEGCDGGAEHCRFVDEIWDHPELAVGPEIFAAALKAFVKENNVSVVFPVSEEFVRFFQEHPGASPSGTIVAMVDPQLVKKCLDKVYILELAAANGVPTAPFTKVGSLDQLKVAVEHTGFPVVIRPEDSTKRLNGKKALFATNADELDRKLSLQPTRKGNLIVQRKVLGRRHNLYFAAYSGQLFQYLHALILRTDNPDGSGLAVDGITIPPMPDLRSYTEKLVTALDYTGIGCAQFLVDEATGAISLLEINPRIAGNHAVPEFAGLNLSTVLIELAAGRELDTTPIEGKAGIRYVWTCGDIEAAKNAWKRSEIGHYDAICWAVRALLTALKADLHMTCSWADPMPGLVAFMRLFPNIRNVLPRIRDRMLHRSNRKSLPHN